MKADVKKILIINLTRMGDIIQTIPMIHGLQQKYPHAKIDVLTIKAFSKILEHASHINKLITLDDKKLVTNIYRNFSEAYLEIYEKINYLNSRKYDLLINPVVSRQSSLLGYLIKAKTKKGIFFNEDREQTIKSIWSSYHLANEHHLGDHSFNLVDIFTHIGELETKPNLFYLNEKTERKENIEKLWKDKKLFHNKVVGFHIGASRSNKAWEPIKFKNVINKLLETTNFKIILFGGYKEKELNSIFKEINSEKFINLIGKTNLSELISAINKIDLFVTNDTGPMHIATAMNTKILDISLGPVSVWETGPYKKGSIVLEAKIDCHPCAFTHKCQHLNCHKYITENSVYNAIKHLLQDAPLELNNEINYWKASECPFGLQHFIPLKKRMIQRRELFFEIKRAVWAISIQSNLKRGLNWPQKYSDYIKKHYEVKHHNFEKDLEKIQGLIKKANEMLNLYTELSRLDLNQKKSIDRIRAKWKVIDSTKKILFGKAQQFNEIYDLFLFSKFRESNLNSEDFVTLIKQTKMIYSELVLQLHVQKKLLNFFHKKEN